MGAIVESASRRARRGKIISVNLRAKKNSNWESARSSVRKSSVQGLMRVFRKHLSRTVITSVLPNTSPHIERLRGLYQQLKIFLSQTSENNWQLWESNADLNIYLVGRQIDIAVWLIALRTGPYTDSLRSVRERCNPKDRQSSMVTVSCLKDKRKILNLVGY